MIVIALVTIVARIFGVVVQRVWQPAVIGEMLLGLLVAPAVFGSTWAHDSTRSNLSALADVGLAIFMFLIGLDTDRHVLRNVGRLSWTVAIGGTVVAFGLGVAFAAPLAAKHGPAGVTPFLLFVGLAMSVTAFPVLARILDDFGLSATPIGAVSLSAAAICDVAAWTLLAILSAATRFAGAAAAWRVLILIPYIAAMALVVAPLLRRAIDRHPGRLPRSIEALLLAGLLLSAACTEALGLHFIFGAFLFGLVTPRGTNSQVRNWVHNSVEPICRILLLPLYFVVAGLSVNVGAFGLTGLFYTVLAITAASLGKLGGTFLVARAQGIRRRRALALATLMNTRGLTELVVLDVGLHAGLLDRDVYTIMVLMALITTTAAGPLLRLSLGVPISEAGDRMTLSEETTASTQHFDDT
jgi:Kef-type K+ transport system membrane component KefB